MKHNLQFQYDKNNLLLLDIGSKYIKATMTKKNWADKIEVLGSIIINTKGIYKNYINDFNALIETIYNVVYQIEIDCNVKIYNVHINLSFIDIITKRIINTYYIQNIVTQEHMDKDSHGEIEDDEYFLGVLNQQYFIDNNLVNNPINQKCKVLVTVKDVVKCKNIDIINLQTIFKKININIANITNNILLMSHDMENNSIIADIGYNRTTVVTNFNGNKKIISLKNGSNYLYKDLWALQKEPQLTFYKQYQEHVDITCEFFVNIIKNIIDEISKNNDTHEKYDVPIFLCGGICLLHGLEFFLQEHFDRKIYILQPKIFMENNTHNNGYFINNYYIIKTINNHP